MTYIKSFIISTIDNFLNLANKIQDYFTGYEHDKYIDRELIKRDNREDLMTFEELAETKGYCVENFYLTTKDGYILKLNRLTLSKKKEKYFSSESKFI